MINSTTAASLNQFTYSLRDKPENRITPQSIKKDSGAMSAESSQKVLNDKLIDAVDKVLQKNKAAAIRTLDTKNYTPTAVSDRILNYVQSAIDRADALGGDRSSLLAQARQGIKRGFQDAENILTSLNALNGKIAENVQKTFDLVQGGLDRISQSPAIQQSQPIQTQEIFQSTQQTQSQSLSLDIKTRDGDVVTISLQKDQSSSNYQAQIRNAQGIANLSEFSFSSSTNFEFAVQGSLDEGEMEAIKALLSDTRSIADKFFNGDAGAALEAGLSLGFDSSELTRFSLSLDQTQTKSATQAYREVSGYSENSDTSRPPPELENLLAPIKNLAESIKDIFINASGSNIAQDREIQDLFSFFSKTETTHQTMIAQLESISGKSFESIIGDIISAIKP